MDLSRKVCIAIVLLTGIQFQSCAVHAVHAGQSAQELTPVQKAFFEALQRGKPDLLGALITEGADVNQSIEGFTPLMLARDAKTVKILAEAGADVNARSELLKQTMLMFAVSNGKADVVQALVDAGADVRAKDPDTGMTALAHAVMGKRSQMEIIRILLEAGANPDEGEILGMSMLNYAAVGGKSEVLQALIEGGADINVANEQGATALMAAVAARRTEAAKVLIDAGADTNASVNSAGMKKKGGTESGGYTAMDVAMITGDDEMMRALESAGAKESDKPPEPAPGKPNPPGLYSLECSLAGSPPPSGKKFSCSAIDEVTESGTETAIYSKAFFDGSHSVPTRDKCVADLGAPGSYTIRTWKIQTPWELICRYRLGKTTGDANWIAVLKKGTPVIKESAKIVKVAEAAEPEAPPERKKPPQIVIVKPKKGDQFAYDEITPDALEIDAEARITGDCDDAATWKIEDIGGSEKQFDPDANANNLTIRFTNLPSENSDFGEKKITASACGKSASVIVEVFFPPEKNNHPGNGNGETPNWFYYWGKTAAGRGFAPEYKEKSPCTAAAVGTYVYGIDKTFLYSTTYSAVCMNRPDGTTDTGIDCYAVTLRHEKIHHDELHYWWDSVPGMLTRVVPAECTGSAFEMLASGQLSKNTWNTMTGVDSDGDLVPDYIEKALAGCDPESGISCPGIPPQVKRRALAVNKKQLDVDMNSYRVSWKQWTIGDADSQDWSWCGKQWKDASICPGGRIR